MTKAHISYPYKAEVEPPMYTNPQRTKAFHLFLLFLKPSGGEGRQIMLRKDMRLFLESAACVAARMQPELTKPCW